MLRVLSLVKYAKDRIQGKAPKGAKRSAQWPKVRKAYLKEHPACAHCGSTKKVEVHHKQPFHMHPELELDPTNFITLCESKSGGVTCHLFFGHLGNYKRVNPHVESDAALWKDKKEEAIKAQAAPSPDEVKDEV